MRGGTLYGDDGIPREQGDAFGCFRQCFGSTQDWPVWQVPPNGPVLE
ncbi:MAG: hypothetical protein AVDCRST_MAG77-639 [uncultured Chloroflexi bacterium]|uniref:Uncharacterized protein n=1 Tax=uncultured Chloroflexota bacterium TaxID=166587 RepID=A0A6J4HGW4_9CHLR|nr:MAG: hypothetical protein AVDCRST_MAG77-639 [uncultured Chloroflexota bacterium]